MDGRVLSDIEFRGVKAEDRDLVEPQLDLAIGDFLVSIFEKHLLDQCDVGGKFGGCAVSASGRRPGDLDSHCLFQSPANRTQEAAI
jgi:hypothetical protein